jgi:uncharacterized protein (TIGR02284 family)
MIDTAFIDAPELIDALYDLLHACRQSQQAYVSAAREAPGSEFTILFSSIASRRNQAMTDLQHYLFNLEKNLHQNGRESGLDRDNQHPYTEQVDTLLRRQELLEACERQDKDTLKYYEHVLQMDLPNDVAHLITGQYNEITTTVQTMQKWKPLTA